MPARVKPDVSGSLYDYTARRFVALDHDRVFADDDPLVVAHPDVFDVVKPAPKTSKKAST